MKRLGRDGAHTSAAVALQNTLVDLGVDDEVEVLVVVASAVDVSVRRVRSTTSVAIDPFEPVLSTVASDQVLEVVGLWNALGFLVIVSTGRPSQVIQNSQQHEGSPA